MDVKIEDFNELQRTVKNLMKIIGAFDGSLKRVKQRVSELEVKSDESGKEKLINNDKESADVEDDVKKSMLESIDNDIKTIKEEQKHNVKVIKSLTEQIKCLDCEQKDLKESMLNKEIQTFKRMNE